MGGDFCTEGLVKVREPVHLDACLSDGHIGFLDRADQAHELTCVDMDTLLGLLSRLNHQFRPVE
jgi:hypothetical protein